jgi:transposase
MTTFIDGWCRPTAGTAIPLLASFAKTLFGFRFAVLNRWGYCFSNGKPEGINNKIGAMHRMHDGPRDFRFLSLRNPHSSSR